jgi:excisionase family DNA binding protein
MEEKNLISTTELAKILGISHVAVYKKIKSGKIKAEKIGRNFVIDKRDLNNILSGELTQDSREEIEEAVKKTVEEYGEALKKLGKT